MIIRKRIFAIAFFAIAGILSCKKKQQLPTSDMGGTHNWSGIEVDDVVDSPVSLGQTHYETTAIVFSMGVVVKNQSEIEISNFPSYAIQEPINYAFSDKNILVYTGGIKYITSPYTNSGYSLLDSMFYNTSDKSISWYQYKNITTTNKANVINEQIIAHTP